ADRPEHDAVEEQRADGAGHVMSEDREMDRRMRAAAVAEDDGHAGDHRGDQDDEPDNNDHDALRGSELLTDAGGPWRPPPHRFRVARIRRGWAGRHVSAVCGSTVLAVLSGARTGGCRRTAR